jgi:hypothetical protein
MATTQQQNYAPTINYGNYPGNYALPKYTAPSAGNSRPDTINVHGISYNPSDYSFNPHTQGFYYGTQRNQTGTNFLQDALKKYYTGGYDAQAAPTAPPTPQVLPSKPTAQPQPQQPTNAFLGGMNSLYTPPPQRARPDATALPQNLNDYAGLSDIQQRSGLATRATQGEGLDDEGKKYYLNLLQRKLMDDQGNISNDNFQGVLPVERNYLQSIGLPIGSGEDFMGGLARYYAAGNQ